LFRKLRCMKIVFLDSAPLGDVSLEPIARLGDFDAYSNSTEKEAAERAADADVIIVNKIPVSESFIAGLPKLKLICVAATGMNNVDLKAAASRGIPVRNAIGYSTYSVAQFCFAQILELNCKTEVFRDRIRQGIYSRSGLFTDTTVPVSELAGKTLGIIGLGTIGSRVAQIGAALGMNVAYFSTTGTNHSSEYPALTLPELLQRSDIISLHCPLNDRTRGLIGAAQLKLMKRSALLINMARGGIVDEAALADALDNGIIAGAAVDTFTDEPLPTDNPLMTLRHPEKLRLSPHVAWASIEAKVRLVECIANNIISEIQKYTD